MNFGIFFFIATALLFGLMGLDVIKDSGLTDITEWTFCCFALGHVFGGIAFAIPAGWVKS